jgi:hypothetical protein
MSDAQRARRAAPRVGLFPVCAIASLLWFEKFDCLNVLLYGSSTRLGRVSFGAGLHVSKRGPILQTSRQAKTNMPQ